MKTVHIIALTLCLTVPAIQAHGESSLKNAARTFLGVQSCITGFLVSTPAIFDQENKSSYLQTGVGFMAIAAGINQPSPELIIHGAQLIFEGITGEKD